MITARPSAQAAQAQAPVPEAVLAAYGWRAVDVDIEPIAGGLINQTYLVRSGGAAAAVLQRLHPIFDAQVNIDLDGITARLQAAGMVTPRLVRTRAGERWVTHQERVWRVLSYVPGVTVHAIPEPRVAWAAAELVGRFHRVLADVSYDYAFARAGVHDTQAHLARLRAALERPAQPSAAPAADGDEALLAQARVMGQAILHAASQLPPVGELPLRHAHGDLKISNILFAPDMQAARCLLDLDTLGRQTIAYELGDAMRSWCNTQGEDVTQPQVAADIFAAAMDGYRAGAGALLTAAERAAIVPGWQTVCVELAARFCVDVFDNSYFGWDAGRFSSRRQHNLVRARGQLALARDVAARRAELEQWV